MSQEKVIQLKDLQSDQDYQAKQIDNIQHDVRLILNVKFVENTKTLVDLKTSVNGLTNSVNSMNEHTLKRYEEIEKKQIQQAETSNNRFWILIALVALSNVALVLFK